MLNINEIVPVANGIYNFEEKDINEALKAIENYLDLNNANKINIASGRAAKVKNNVMNIAGQMISGILCGNDKNPIKKNIITCDNAVTPSKKCIKLNLFLISELPNIIPVI